MSVTFTRTETTRIVRADVDDEAPMTPDDDERGDRFQPGRINAHWFMLDDGRGWHFIGITVTGGALDRYGFRRPGAAANVRQARYDAIDLDFAPEWVRQFAIDSKPEGASFDGDKD